MDRALVVVLAGLLSSSALAEPKAYLERDNPTELPVAVSSGLRGCPFTDEALESTVYGVLMGAQIEPVDWTRTEEQFGLLVGVDCVAGGLYLITIEFVDVLAGFPVRYDFVSGATFGSHAGNPDFLLDEVQRTVELAIRDYRDSNFERLPETEA